MTLFQASPRGRVVPVVLARRRGRSRRGGGAADVEQRREAGPRGRVGPGLREVGEIEPRRRHEQLLHEIQVADRDVLQFHDGVARQRVPVFPGRRLLHAVRTNRSRSLTDWT